MNQTIIEIEKERDNFFDLERDEKELGSERSLKGRVLVDDSEDEEEETVENKKVMQVVDLSKDEIE